MVQKRPFKLPGFRAYVEEIQQVTAREAATQIVGRLQFLGPWYSGQFAKNWVVRVGDVRIPATVEQGAVNKKIPRPGQIPLPPIPSLRGTGKKKVVGYSIDNRTTYRRIAMDLVPGRVERASVLSAPQDGYRDFTEGGSLADVLKVATGKAATNPRIKGFKSSRFIGPAGRVEP